MEKQQLQHLGKDQLVEIVLELQGKVERLEKEQPSEVQTSLSGATEQASEENYEIRIMSRNEIDFAVALAKAEGWNPGIYDADCFYATDPNGFLIGLLNGQPISCISVIKYGSGTYAFLGFYIVKPEYRGRGFGYRIWQEGMKYLEGRDVGLDGVIAQVENYAQSDFKLAYYNTRYQGKAVGGCRNADPRIVELADIPFEDLLAYDDTLFPTSRSEFLRLWIDRPEGVALGIKEGNQLVGYTVLRKCYEGYKVGPLFADNKEFAEALFQALSSRVPRGTPIFLDVPGEEQNPAATELAMKYDMVKVFKTARMYRMRDSSTEMLLPLERWFGVTTFELG